jgi:chromosome segregation ATPase
MARPGITYNEVVGAIDSIIAAGADPTIQRIRDNLGSGSPNTIHKHLSSWRDARPPSQRTAPELPADLQSAILREIARQAAGDRAALEKDLAATQKEAAVLARTGEELEELNTELVAQNEALAAEKERLAALAEERKKEVEELKKELTRERQAAEHARIQVAQAFNKAEVLNEQLAQSATRLAQAEAEIKTAQTGQIAADKTLAVVETKLVAEQAVSAGLRDQLTTAGGEIDSLKSHILELRREAKQEISEARTEAIQARACADSLQAELRQCIERRTEVVEE